MATAADPDANLRRLRARLGGLALAASRDPKLYTAAVRAAFLRRFEVEGDPGGALPVKERLRRGEAARRLHFTRLAMKSARARAAHQRRSADPGSAAGSAREVSRVSGSPD